MRLLILFLFANSCIFAQSSISIDSRVKSVQIFQPGATIYREAKVQIGPGQHDLVFKGLSIGLDPNTIQLYGNDRIEIISFELKNLGVANLESSKEYKALEGKILENKDAIADLDAELEALRIEKNILEENRKIGGNSGYSMEQLQAINTYAKKQILSNSKAYYQVNKKKQELNEKLKSLTNDLNELRRKLNQLQSAIIVRVNCEKAVNTQLGLSYSYRSNINWDPLYRLEFSGLDQGLKLDQLASIYQNTGENLNGVEITLSTGSPSYNNQVPRLQTNFINLYVPYTNRGAQADEPAMLQEVVIADQRKASLQKLSSNRLEENALMETRQDFKLQGKYLLPNGKQETVALRSLELEADYHYETVPKLDPTVYLMAKLKNYEAYQLIPGKVSIFNQGAFSGSFFTDFKSVDGKLALSLGQDRSFDISYERVFNEERTTLFGGTKVELYHYRIKLKPSRVNGNELIVKDQIPISQNRDLKVKLLESVGADYDSETGFLSWKMQLLNTGPKQIDFKYELKYPSDQEVR